MPEISTGVSSTNREADTISKQSLSTSALISSPWYSVLPLKMLFIKTSRGGSIWIYFEGDSSHEFTLQ